MEVSKEHIANALKAALEEADAIGNHDYRFTSLRSAVNALEALLRDDD